MKLRKDFEDNSIISYLDISHLVSKTDYPREIYSKSPIAILCINETKLDSYYIDAQFEIPGYQYPLYRKDSNKNGGGKIVLIKKDLITKRLKAFSRRYFWNDLSRSHNISTSLVHNLCSSIPYNKNKDFFSELSKTLSLTIRKYENILIIGDLNT